jgi:hypothetical protein
MAGALAGCGSRMAQSSAPDKAPPVLQLRSDNPDPQRGQVYPLSAGRFRLRIRTLCGTPGAEATIVRRAGPL